jgi:glucose uptake protein GlcU
MKELLIVIIEFIGGSFELLSNSKNPKKTILISFGLFFIVIAIVYYLTKDFK